MSAAAVAALLSEALPERPNEAGQVLLHAALASLLAELREAEIGYPGPWAAFEDWLVQRYREHITSEEYRASAEYAYLAAEWERQFIEGGS